MHAQPTAFEYVRSAGGLERNAEYPYSSGEGKTGECKDEKHDELATFDGRAPPISRHGIID